MIAWIKRTRVFVGDISGTETWVQHGDTEANLKRRWRDAGVEPAQQGPGWAEFDYATGIQGSRGAVTDRHEWQTEVQEDTPRKWVPSP
jgi:hypothetical protein